jgi:hypothetical protein
MKADTYADYPSKHPSPYWKAKFKEAYNEYGCVTFCEDSSKCKYRNKFDHRIVKAEKITARYSRKLMNCLNRLAGKNPFDIRDILGSSNKLKNMIMKQEMQKSILKIQTAVETLTRQKVIDKNVYDFIHGEIKSLSESVENIVEVNTPDETLLTFTDKEKYVNQHINLADTSVLCKELNRRKEIGNDFFVIRTEGKIG